MALGPAGVRWSAMSEEPQQADKRIGTVETADGARLQWASYGEGPGLVLIAGQATTHVSWLHVLPQLARRRRVVVFDHRGVGRSTLGEPDGLSTRALAQDALAVMTDAGLERADVYGHSMGGRIGQWLAIDAPERVRRLVLASTTGGDRRDGPRGPGIDAALASGDRKTMTPLFFTDGFAAQHPDVVEQFFARDADLTARRMHFQASRGHDAWGDLPRITAPTLVLHGADDQVTRPDSARQLAELIPSAQRRILEGQRHCPHLESTEALEAVEELLAAD